MRPPLPDVWMTDRSSKFSLSIPPQRSLIKFITLKAAPHVTVVDLGGEVPNWLINATDLQLVLGAFKGNTYPPVAFPNQGGPADCP